MQRTGANRQSTRVGTREGPDGLLFSVTRTSISRLRLPRAAISEPVVRGHVRLMPPMTRRLAIGVRLDEGEAHGERVIICVVGSLEQPQDIRCLCALGSGEHLRLFRPKRPQATFKGVVPVERRPQAGARIRTASSSQGCCGLSQPRQLGSVRFRALDGPEVF